MKKKLRARAPGPVTNLKAGDSATAESWAITLPLDRAVADIERRWGSLDLFLSYASDKHREQFARVFARVNKAIETLDNDALKKAAASACKGLDVIGETIAERGLEPPDVRYLGLDGLILAETAEDAKRLRDHFEGSPRIYSLAEFALIVEKFEVENSTVKAAKEILGGRVEAICERTPLEQELNDCVPF